jgi:hypothetical protein
MITDTAPARKKMGRPVTGLARKNAVMVRLNDAELLRLTDAALAVGVPLSVFLRLATVELLEQARAAGE